MRDAGHRTPDAGHRTSDNGHRTSDGEKSKNNISTPQGGGHNKVTFIVDDHKVDHLRETCKELLFSLKKIKINLKILRYIEKYDFLKQTRHCVSTQCIPGRDMVEAGMCRA